jgi:hypothetical protein
MSSNDQLRQYDDAAKEWKKVGAEKRHLAPYIAKISKHYLKDIAAGSIVPSVDIGANDGLGTMLAVQAIEKETGIRLRPAFFDVSEKALDEARKNVAQMWGEDHGHLITSDYDSLSSDNEIVLSTHVVQAFATKGELSKLYFKRAFNLLAPGGHFISTGNNPDPKILTQLHSGFQCKFPDGKIADGAKIKTDLYSENEEVLFRTITDHFWSLPTLRLVAREAGFVIKAEYCIPDFEVPFARGGKDISSPYLTIVWQRPEAKI